LRRYGKQGSKRGGLCRFEEKYMQDHVHLRSGSVFVPDEVPDMRDLLESNHEGEAPEDAVEAEVLIERHREIDVDEKGCALGTGKRKESRARVWLSHGQGDVIVNGLPLAKYFKLPVHRSFAIAPLLKFSQPESFTMRVLVNGGGAVLLCLQEREIDATQCRHHVLRHIERHHAQISRTLCSNTPFLRLSQRVYFLKNVSGIKV
jgi:hypothetical protein